jgi:prophage regulatory protein
MVYQLEAQDLFPRRIKLGMRAVGWLETEVQAWLASRVHSSRGYSQTRDVVVVSSRSEV